MSPELQGALAKEKWELLFQQAFWFARRLVANQAAVDGAVMLDRMEEL
jgi:hypothetical protein